MAAGGSIGYRGRRSFTAQGREADGPEREALWRRVAAAVPRVETYQRAVKRRVPIVVLVPEDGSPP